MAHLERALAALPTAAGEADLLQALVRAACPTLGWSAARVRRADSGESLAAWPEGQSFEPAAVSALPWGLRLEVAGPGVAEPLPVLAQAAGKMLEEARLRARLTARLERLTRHARESEERHRSLTHRLAELRGELDTTQQRQVVLQERNRIAQDLHDRAAQTNFLLALKLDWAMAHLAADDPLQLELAKLKELAAQAADQTREAIYALRASEMSEGGLQEGLKRLVRSMEPDGFTTSFTIAGIPAALSAEVEDALFKLAQEALNNARKHSYGSTVIVALRFHPQSVTLVVQDDGIGLPKGMEEAPPGHLGLKGMRERAAALGGELQLMSGDEGGLMVRATIPIQTSPKQGG